MADYVLGLEIEDPASGRAVWWALSNGKKTFVVPNTMTDMNAGNEFINSGAVVVFDPKDFLEKIAD